MLSIYIIGYETGCPSPPPFQALGWPKEKRGKTGREEKEEREEREQGEKMEEEEEGEERKERKTRTEGPLNLPQILRHIFTNCL